MPPRPCQQRGGGGVEDKKAAPDSGNAAGMAHAFGRQAGVLQAGEALDQGLLGKQAGAEHGEHQQGNGHGIPIHGIGLAQQDHGGEESGQQ